MNGISEGINSYFRTPNVENTSVAPVSQAVGFNTKADEFNLQAADAKPKKKFSFGIFGRIASAILKTNATVKEGTNGIVAGAAQGVALGGVAYGVGALVQGTMKVAKDQQNQVPKDQAYTFFRLFTGPFRAAGKTIANAAKYVKEVVIDDKGLRTIATDIIKAPFKFLKNFFTTVDASPEMLGKAKEAAKAARGETKNIFKKLGAGSKAFNQFLTDNNVQSKIVSKPIRIIAFSVGAAVFIYNAVRAKLAINKARHDIDAKFVKTPTLNNLHHQEKQGKLQTTQA